MSTFVCLIECGDIKPSACLRDRWAECHELGKRIESTGSRIAAVCAVADSIANDRGQVLIELKQCGPDHYIARFETNPIFEVPA